MESFLLGLLGALSGGIIVSGAVVAFFVYDRRQAEKAAALEASDLKKLYMPPVASKIFN